MKKNFKAIAIAMLACTAFVACSNDDEPKKDDQTQVTPDDDDDDDVKENELASGSKISGEIKEDTILVEDGEYTLTGKLHVLAGATLTIKPGVVITSDYETDGTSDNVADADMRYILIERGGKIDAQGTEAKPIVMTSVSEVAGAWGGIHICGDATTNTKKDSESEIGGKLYGGDNDDDNSGVLKYVIVKYTGQSLNAGQECNGISFYGVGRGTQVSHVSALDGTDDGFEFFGGTVDIKYALVRDCQDDSFDWTDGWRGRGQFLVAYHTKDNNDCLMECDTQGDNNEATPASKPVFSNVTLVGVDNPASSSKNVGVMLKAGTQIELYNAIIAGKTNAIYVKTPVSNAALYEGPSALSSVYTFSETALFNKETEGDIYDESQFVADGNVVGEVSALPLEGYVGTVADATVTAMSDDFFESVDYVGAVEASNDWTAVLK